LEGPVIEKVIQMFVEKEALENQQVEAFEEKLPKPE
jgi:hypothetical protein